MINMIKVDYVPQTCEWIHSSSSSGHDGAVATLAVYEIHDILNFQNKLIFKSSLVVLKWIC